MCFGRLFSCARNSRLKCVKRPVFPGLPSRQVWELSLVAVCGAQGRRRVMVAVARRARLEALRTLVAAAAFSLATAKLMVPAIFLPLGVFLAPFRWIQTWRVQARRIWRWRGRDICLVRLLVGWPCLRRMARPRILGMRLFLFPFSFVMPLVKGLMVEASVRETGCRWRLLRDVFVNLS